MKRGKQCRPGGGRKWREHSTSLCIRGSPDRWSGELRPLPGTFRRLENGFAYERDDRHYRLWTVPRYPLGRSYVVDTEANIAGNRHWRRLDISISACRWGFAREIALEQDRRIDPFEIVRDLNLSRFHIEGIIIDQSLRDDESTAGDDVEILALPRRAALGVMRLALAAGARVRRRRSDGI